MSGHRDRETDRLLRAELRRVRSGEPPASPACVDTETLAAWADGSLPSDGAERVVLHLADCARCQAMMAAFARAEPAAPAVAPARGWLSVKWWLPLSAAAAASLVMWLAWPSAPGAPEPAMSVADARDAASPAIPAPPVDRPAAQAGTGPAEARIGAPETEAGRSAAAASAMRSAARPGGRPEEPAGAASPAAPPPPPPAVIAAPPAGAAAGDPRSPTMGGLPRQTLNVSAGAGMVAERAADAFAAAGVIAEFAAPDAPLARTVAGGTGAARAEQALRAAAPLRWRILDSGVVERSATGGASWEPVTIDPPSLRLTGGAAPSARACWLIGREGVVLRSTDGRSFARVPFPERVDLASIRASSDRDVEITTADGRVFRTADGGLTWTRLQGFPPPSF